MKTSFAIAAVCASLLASVLDAAAQDRSRAPRFGDYPVKEVYKGKSAKPVLRTAKHREYEAYINAVADGGTGFAGHYAVIMLTCGADCVTADFLDLRTGRIVQRTFSTGGWRQTHDAFRKIEFRSDSRLIVFAGGVGGKPPLGWHFYVFDNDKLKRLHTIVTGGDFRKPLTEWMK